MKSTHLLRNLLAPILFALVPVLTLRADIPVEVRTTGFGVIVLAEPVPRAALAKLVAETPAGPDARPAALWLRWADGSLSAIDNDVNRLLPNRLLKVYTMSSISPALTPGTREGPATVVALPLAPFAPEDWTLKPNEPSEKADLVAAFHRRYGSGATPADLQYYQKPDVFTDKSTTKAERRAARKAVEARPAPALRANRTKPVRIDLPVTLLQAGVKPGQGLLNAGPEDLAPLPRAVQIPLGNYNYDLETISSLDKPNELTVAEGQGLDVFALAQRQWGPRAVAAVEMICYNGFTATLTAPGQGLLLTPPDGNFAAALAAGEALHAAFEEPIIVALRQPDQSPAECASGVLAINVLLR